MEAAEYLANKKNRACRQFLNEEVVITADTVVIVNGRVLGKPSHQKEASDMLRLLSGQVHQVVTGVCISNAQKYQLFSHQTEVRVKKLSEEEIHRYLHLCQPFDKAGAYGIQEWFGLIAIEWIGGSFYNVVGLPIHEVYQSLTTRFNIFPFK